MNLSYLPILTTHLNRKGVLDIDSVKGCFYGMKTYPDGGCYGLCYACKTAKYCGFDFTKSISRQPLTINEKEIEKTVTSHTENWFRIGTMGDPSHDWPLTLYICEWLGKYKTPIIVTKHWIEAPSIMLEMFKKCKVILNTSISALDTQSEIDYRIGQFYRFSQNGIRSYLRIVSVNFGNSEKGKYLKNIQNWLFMHNPIIDTPLRINPKDIRVTDGDIISEKIHDMNTLSSISLLNKNTYIGICKNCPDKCGYKKEN